MSQRCDHLTGFRLAHLTQLDVSGFKSFANQTSFFFDRGVTAIIGPNGSGKSNISEALRWVLGEQQYSNLRGRRTEDVIFAGSERRGRMGMAEVTLTIDNSSGALPIEFNEVSITRRAHRTGENQYLINGNRVRLKDVQQLTAPLGQAHTIVGQGLVDAVLSQRPEDRRGLFEHAAGITGLRMQSVSAERGLLEAEENTQRLRDIVSELEPRVRSLARRARQAEQYETVREQLVQRQREYYGALWFTAEKRREEAAHALDAAAANVREQEKNQARERDQLESLRASEREITGKRAEIAQQVNRLESEISGARHSLDLTRAEMRAAKDRVADQLAVRTRIESEQAERRASLATLEKSISEMLAEHELLVARHTEASAHSESAHQQRAELETRRREIDQRTAVKRQANSQIEAQLAGISERQVVLNRSSEDLTRRAGVVTERIRLLDQEIIEASARLESVEIDAREKREARDSAERALDDLERDIRVRGNEVIELERELERLKGRLDLLGRIWAEGEGLHAGVRAVLRAARSGEISLGGLIGTVAEVIDVPADVETAIEVALGGHLQDIIVRAWDDAERGISYLKQTKAGRARFQPLDAIRPGRPRSLDSPISGLIDRAAKLVTYDPEVEPVIAQVLGRTLVATDLDAARRIARQTEGWTIVTLQGELIAPTGSVTGGTRTRGSGLLARERERRELPVTIASLEKRIEEKQTASAARLQIQERQVRQLDRLDQELARARTDERAAREHISSRDRELAAEKSELERLERERAIVSTSLADLAERAQQLETSKLELEEEIAVLKNTSDEIDRQFAALAPLDGLQLATMSAELAALNERIRAAEREQETLARQFAASEQVILERTSEIEDIEARQSALVNRAVGVEDEIKRLEGQLSDARSGTEPLEERLGCLKSAIRRGEQALDQVSSDLRDAERAHDRAVLEMSRADDAASFLRSRILDELEIEDPSAIAVDTGGPAPDAEDRIRRLRDQLRRIGSVGEDVIEEYREESQRLDHLTKQLEDIAGAAESLRDVLTDLRRQMNTRFGQTFDEVATEFESTFKRLFGGGSARLAHEMDGSDPGGIDIVAQPPGKRLQGLNQLSGGERALTAVALLIAIQRVNPSPFCLLDEVDAALDESNVIRFRQELRDLAQETQYIVITHNRGTIEGADTLYGITMGEDSVSRVLSLRLDQAIEVIEDDRLLEMESVI